MKIKTSILPLFTVSTGVLGMIFRFWLNTAGTDKEGLVIPSHPSVALMFIVAAATVLVLGLCAWGMDKTPKPFNRSTAGAVGCFLGGAGILVSDLIEFSAATDIVGTVSFIFGLAAAACFVYMGLCRLKGTPGSIWAHVAVCAYFMVHLVLQYRQWSSIPQLQDYFFPLLGSVFLMLCAFHRACKDLNQESEPQFLFFNQAALFCCFLSLSSSWVFYASMALWTMLDLFPIKKEV